MASENLLDVTLCQFEIQAKYIGMHGQGKHNLRNYILILGHGDKIPINFLYERQVHCLRNAPYLDYLFKWLHVENKIFQIYIFCVFI